MSDIKKVDLGGGGASIYIYIYIYSPLSVLTCSGRNSVKFATGSWMYSTSCLEGANGWRPQATQANYRASLLIATTTPEKNIIVTIRSLLTIPPKSGNQKNRLGEQTRFKQNPWILAIYIYIPYFGINRFPDLWILAIYSGTLFSPSTNCAKHQAMLGRFPFWASNRGSPPCLTWKQLQWKTGAVEDGHSMHFERILYILVWPDLQKI